MIHTYKFLLAITAISLCCNTAYASTVTPVNGCETSTKIYTACKPGYYLIDRDLYTRCSPCPSGGTSADKNTSGITACYLPSGTTGSDGTGTYIYTANCYYSN